MCTRVFNLFIETIIAAPRDECSGGDLTRPRTVRLVYIYKRYRRAVNKDFVEGVHFSAQRWRELCDER